MARFTFQSNHPPPLPARLGHETGCAQRPAVSLSWAVGDETLKDSYDGSPFSALPPPIPTPPRTPPPQILKTDRTDSPQWSSYEQFGKSCKIRFYLT